MDTALVLLSLFVIDSLAIVSRARTSCWSCMRPPNVTGAAPC